MIRHDQHPWWCAKNHHCTADAPAGQHRSGPVTFDTHNYRLVATRLRTNGGRDQLELRAVVDLPANMTQARHRARILIAAVCLALGPHRPIRRNAS